MRPRSLSLRRLLTTRCARWTVVCLLALIATPFTAPFATCDLSTPGLQTSLDEDGWSSLSDKTAADVAMPAFGPASASVALTTAGLAFTPSLSFAGAPRSAPLPLRL
jgi:hypothetical protein